MVTITNGVRTFDVPSGSVSSFATAGFRPVGDTKTKAKAAKPVEEPAEEQELIEKPISQWKKDEVKQFAEENGIDISGTKNANEAKEIIKKFLDGEA